MKILIVQKEVFVEMAEKFSRVTERTDALHARLDCRSGNEWERVWNVTKFRDSLFFLPSTYAIFVLVF